MTGAVVEQSDLIVVGAGIAGLTAAVGVAEAGYQVTVLERSDAQDYICSTRLTGGVFHCALQAPDTPAEKLASHMIAKRGDAVNAGLAKAIARDVMPAIRWLQEQGVRFIRTSADPWQKFVLAPPSLGRGGSGWQGRGGDTLLRLLGGKLAGNGGRLIRGVRARALALDQQQQVRAVVADGLEIPCRAVVIADGGFQQNMSLLEMGVSPRPDLLIQRNGGTGWGDGLEMVAAIGGGIYPDLRGFYGHVVSRDAFNDPDLRFYPWLDELARHGMAVMANGRRFCDESLGGIHLANRIAALADPAGVTVIWDDAIWRGPGRARFMAANPALDKRGATVYRANTLEELAGRAGIDVAGLAAEVANHNAAVASGSAERLSVPRRSDGAVPYPIITPPFAAAPVAAGLTNTMGGIDVDCAMHVTRSDWTIFNNLWAVGGSIGGLEGGDMPLYTGGLAKGAASGWRAARSIIDLLKSDQQIDNG